MNCNSELHENEQKGRQRQRKMLRQNSQHVDVPVALRCVQTAPAASDSETGQATGVSRPPMHAFVTAHATA